MRTTKTIIPTDYEFYKREYLDNNRSIPDIAESLGTYTNRVRRIMIKLGIPIRNKEQAGKIAYSSGRMSPPMQGKRHNSETVKKISNGVTKALNSLSEQDRTSLHQARKKHWDSLTPEKKEEMRQKASEGLRRSSKDGSRLELFILQNLRLLQKFSRIYFHHEMLLKNNKMHCDLYIDDIKTVIEVDGPFHTREIFPTDQEQISRREESDNYKNGLCLNAGLNIVRLMAVRKNLSLSYFQERFDKLLPVLKDVVDGKITNQLVIIEDNNE